MKTKDIGGVAVHPVGIGTWLMGGSMYEDKTAYAIYEEDKKYIAAIQYAIKHGQNHIDTAQMYGAGHTEELVGKALQIAERKNIFLASKLWKSHLRRSSVIPAVEGMLSRLNTSYLDLLYVHNWWGEYESVEHIMAGLNDAIDQKLVRAIGVSNYSLEHLQQAVKASKHPISAIQNYYSVTQRSDASEELRNFCEHQGIAFVAYRPLDRGIITTNIVVKMAKKYAASPQKIALAWLLSQKNVHVIPKAVNTVHIDENRQAADIQLEEADIQSINSI